MSDPNHDSKKELGCENISFTCRKRKFDNPSNLTRKHSTNETMNSSWHIDYNFTHSNMFSSTMNDSITTGLERCNLISCVGNFGGEKSSILENNTPPYSPELSSSECSSRLSKPLTPGKASTPTKPFSAEIPSYFHPPINSSPTKTSPMLKLGSPERNEILYSNLFQKSKDNKKYSPAKRKLFVKVKIDPIQFLTEEGSYPHLIKKIFTPLYDSDLYSCIRVSEKWRKTLMSDLNIKQRVDTFVRTQVMNKENICSDLSFGYFGYHSPTKQSTPFGQRSNNVCDSVDMLQKGQSLQICLRCNAPKAIVEHNISQCGRKLCGFIRCIKCGSFSETGPADFKDKCEESQLLFDVPKKKRGLFDSPPSPTTRRVRDSGLPSFLTDESSNPVYVENSSGYVTESDLSLNTERHSDSIVRHKQKMNMFQAHNHNVVANRRSAEGVVQQIVPVIQIKKSRVVEDIEPSSPPKITYSVCSKKSKKMLKRL